MECLTFIAASRCSYRFASLVYIWGSPWGRRDSDREKVPVAVEGSTPGGLQVSWEHLWKAGFSRVRKEEGSSSLLLWLPGVKSSGCSCPCRFSLYIKMDEVSWDNSGALFSSIFNRKQKVIELREETDDLEEELMLNGKS